MAGTGCCRPSSWKNICTSPVVMAVATILDRLIKGSQALQYLTLYRRPVQQIVQHQSEVRGVLQKAVLWQIGSPRIPRRLAALQIPFAIEAHAFERIGQIAQLGIVVGVSALREDRLVMLHVFKASFASGFLIDENINQRLASSFVVVDLVV